MSTHLTRAGQDAGTEREYQRDYDEALQADDDEAAVYGVADEGDVADDGDGWGP